MLNGKAKSDELIAAEKTLEFVKAFTDNIKTRLDHPDAPITDPATRHKSVIETLSGGAMALICVGHPFGEIAVKMANMASQVGEGALDYSVSYFSDVVREAK